ncbi:hypothetical protein ACFL27_15660, partial [candidate division CSSED10-310 bacterium]
MIDLIEKKAMNVEKIRLFQLRKQKLLQKASPVEYIDLLQQQIGLHSTDNVTPYFPVRFSSVSMSRLLRYK